MAATMRESRRRVLGDLEDCSVKWSDIGQNRLERLLELRAVVASLRADREQELLDYLRADYNRHRP